MTAALEIQGLDVTYGAIRALRDVSLTVGEGSFVALVGANGAGKSTLLKAVSRLLPFEGGRATARRMRFFGEDIADMPTHRLARRGLLQVREGRHVFPAMTVEENLIAATFALQRRARRGKARGFDDIYGYFPPLAPRRASPAGLLSGGEQQMLAIGRALVGEPRLLLVDEASLGLAPLIARGIFDILERINREKRLAILVVEQNVSLALEHVSYGYVLENGRVALEGPAANLADREMISRRYLGVVDERNAAPTV
ncbi:MAG: ABC transporter ATP-binding protein [Hyphomicrobiales bacterium]